jgi:hypothetical protein
MSHKPHLRTWVGASLAATLAAASLAVGATAAHAAPSLGKLSITPATGNEITALTARTSEHCNVGDTGINVYVSGPGVNPGTDILQGFTAIDQVDGTDGLSFSVTGIFRDVWQNNSIADPSGTYTVRIACVGADFFTETGEFTQSATMTPNDNPNGADYVFTASGAATQTTLDPVTPVDPIVHGTDSTLTAHVRCRGRTRRGHCDVHRRRSGRIEPADRELRPDELRFLRALVVLGGQLRGGGPGQLRGGGPSLDHRHRQGGQQDHLRHHGRRHGHLRVAEERRRAGRRDHEGRHRPGGLAQRQREVCGDRHQERQQRHADERGEDDRCR